MENVDPTIVVVPEEAPQKKELRLRKKKCLKCHYLCNEKDNLFECQNDPECPARWLKITIGRDPEKLALMLSKVMTNPDPSKKSDFDDIMDVVKDSEDGMAIISRAHRLASEQDVPM